LDLAGGQKRPVLLLATAAADAAAADALVLVDRGSGDVVQVLRTSYSVIHVVAVEDDSGAVAAVLACGTDGRVHAYTFDAQGTLRRAKHNRAASPSAPAQTAVAAASSLWLRRALDHRATDREPCTDAIPIRLLASDATGSTSYHHHHHHQHQHQQHRHSHPHRHHLLVGYSDGMLEWVSVAAQTPT